jgi:RHS repeat-associated protein
MSASRRARSYTYDPDGNPTTSGSGATTNLQYDGGHQIAGLDHFAARYYDPGSARWTQQDPINQITSLTEANRYSYMAADPVNGRDLSGTRSLIGGLVGLADGCLEGGAKTEPVVPPEHYM